MQGSGVPLAVLFLDKKAQNMDMGLLDKASPSLARDLWNDLKWRLYLYNTFFFVRERRIGPC
jgi:hypothetical protein